MHKGVVLRCAWLVLMGSLAANTAGADSAARTEQPAPPRYQPLMAMGPIDRQHPEVSGEVLFSNRCGACHLEGGMGTNLLTVQQLQLGRSAELGLLAKRTDLTAAYIKVVVRHGKVLMPPLSAVDVTDAELERIADYLAP